MKTLRYFLISFSWLPIIALAAWWAGFMPFPTRPEELGREAHTFDGLKGPSPIKSNSLLISASNARDKAKGSPYGLGQWYCEPERKEFCHLYEIIDEPFFGLINARWVLTVNAETPVALYATYAACKWTEERKQRAYVEDRVTYERWATEQHQKVEAQAYEFYICVRTPK
jgi:hypothetical protein